MEAEVALRNAWISSLNMVILILGVWESISETELWRSDDNGESSVHGVDRRLEADHLMRELLWCGTENLANRMYGLFRLQRYASALEVAERLFAEDDHEAWLWDWRKDPENTTILMVNARPYGVQFALDIAQATGDSSQATLWAARAEALGLVPKLEPGRMAGRIHMGARVTAEDGRRGRPSAGPAL
jgi:hypothetical protein